MKTKQIQDAILRELQRAARELSRDQLYALCVPSSTSNVLARFPRALYRLVDDGRVAQRLNEADGVLRYSLPTERYRMRNTINAWHVERKDHGSPTGWRTVVQGTEREARLCAGVLNASETKAENTAVSTESRAARAQLARRRA